MAFTLGHNTPLADLMVISPRKQHFIIDVKGQWAKSPWILKRKRKRTELYYVLALVPPTETNRFFILSQKIANKLVQRSRRKRPGQQWDGFPFRSVGEYENKWKLLPR
ncbi:MAG: hypothetical protein KGK33_08140 [Hyphomicrobiales bacterium]|nr:hypothetical protein [Hyphomicrobiales bacterium]